MRLAPRLTASVYLLVVPVALATAQQNPTSQPDSLRLGELHQQAVTTDPRQRQFSLLSRQTDLRVENLNRERLPSFSADGKAQYQSDVFSRFPGAPAGSAFPDLPHDTYDARLSVEQPILDPTIGPRKGVEQAELAESEAGVRTTLYNLRQEVNEAFFTAALLGERSRLIAATIQELERRLQETAVRVREGAALPGDTAAIRATLLERLQDKAKVDADRRAALFRLTDLIKRPVSDSDPLALPDLTAEADQARSEFADLRVRPEYDQFARTRDRLTSQEDVVAADQHLRLSAFGYAGYGRPGINPVNTAFDAYFVAGLEVKWAPFNWGSTGREREALAVQRQIVEADEEAFTSSLARAVQNDLATIDRLDSALVQDDQIVLLRDKVERESRLRFQEGELTASEYLDRTTDVLEARLAQATHRVQQVQARASFLTTLGLEIQ